MPRRPTDIACLAALAAAFLVVCCFWAAGRLGAVVPERGDDYVDLLFDDSRVHSVDLAVDDWEGFLEGAGDEEYVQADVTVDGETLRGVGLRVKGNNSKRLVGEYGGMRYSLKVELDHFDDGLTYHGLDKFSLDASYQDNSYLKNYIALDMMRFMGVPAPAASYAWVTVNGEPWGLFLAVEEPEEAFARRMFGEGAARIYKPEYASLDERNGDVALCYLGDDPESYPAIFDRARTPTTADDERRVIEALRALDEGGDLNRAVDVDEVLRYFAVQAFTANLDSYLGRTGHNYFLCERDGRLSMVPWDYNLAFGTYALGRPELPDDASVYVNLPIDTPAPMDVLEERPMYHNLMVDDGRFERYSSYVEELVEDYVLGGRLEERVRVASDLIAPYVAKDPTAFCSYGDHRLAVETFLEFCLLRGESVRGQLGGSVPSSWAEQERAADLGDDPYVDCSHIRLEDMGEIADLVPRGSRGTAAPAE